MPTPNPETLKLSKDFPRPAVMFAVARTTGSGRAYFGGSDFKVVEADLAAAKFEPKELYAHDSYVTGLALAGKLLISGGYDGKLKWYDTDSGKLVRTLDAHAKWVRRVTVSPDGKLVASVADDMACKLWDSTTGRLLHELRGHAEKTPQHFHSMLHAAAFSADGKLIATGDKVGHVVVWDVVTGKTVATLESPGMYTWDSVQRRHSIGGVRSLAFSPDGSRLAAGGVGKIGNIDHLDGKARVELFDWRAGKSLAVAESDKFKGLVNRIVFAPDGAWLLGAGGANEGFLFFLDLGKQKFVREEKTPTHVHDFVLSPAADMLTLAGHNRVAVYTLGPPGK